MDKNSFLATLPAAGGRASFGTFVMSGSPLIAEAVGWCGFDWAIVDGEHSPVDTLDIAHLLQALAATPTAPVVRVPWNDAVVVKRVLDAGAPTLLFPFVQSADEAARAVAATRYPPEGIRGMAGLTRASRFGAVPDHFRTANDRIAVIVQIETPLALERLEQIASVPGVDALFIGPTDLSGAMGYAGNGQHPEVQAALHAALGRCQAAGKPLGTLATSPEQAANFRGAGFAFVAVGSDLGMLTGQARSYVARCRQPANGPASDPEAAKAY